MTDELYHHGILGQKWGIRRYQNEDGSLTSEGRKRYGLKEYKAERAKLRVEGENRSKAAKRINEINNEMDRLRKGHNFDYDDGGGGRTKADKEAGRKYARLLSELDDLEIDKHNAGVTYANRILESKYGKQKISELRQKDYDRQALNTLLGLVGGVVLLAGAPMALNMALEKRG